MNFLQRIFCECEPEVVEKIIEVVKEVPVLVDPTEYERVAKEVQVCWKRMLKLEQQCSDMGMKLQYVEKIPSRAPYSRYFPHFDQLREFNLKVVASMSREFGDDGRG